MFKILEGLSFYHEEMCTIDAEGMPNSVDPDHLSDGTFKSTKSWSKLFAKV